MKYIVFYAGLPVTVKGLTLMELNNELFKSVELFNYSYMYYPPDKSWWRPDCTPLLDCDVPKELKLQVLLLT